jgi:hypothetical protein
MGSIKSESHLLVSEGERLMATESQVAGALRERIRNNSPDKLAKAGALWREVPFGFYYGNNNDSIDTVVSETVAGVIAPANLPDDVWHNLEGLIGPTTLIRKGIKIMWLATLRSE